MSRQHCEPAVRVQGVEAGVHAVPLGRLDRPPQRVQTEPEHQYTTLPDSQNTVPRTATPALSAISASRWLLTTFAPETVPSAPHALVSSDEQDRHAMESLLRL